MDPTRFVPRRMVTQPEMVDGAGDSQDLWVAPLRLGMLGWECSVRSTSASSRGARRGMKIDGNRNSRAP